MDTSQTLDEANRPLRDESDAGIMPESRYARQSLFAPIGQEGQRRLGAGRALIVGCGALGTVLANNLARAGVGFLRVVDRDYVEGNNLQRQILFDESDALRGLPKAIAARERLTAVNHFITVDARVTDLTVDNVDELLDGIDVVLDGTDNFETRYLLNDVCVKAGIPWVYSGVVAAHGVSMTIRPGVSACLRCVFPDRPLPGTSPTCDTVGVLNGVVGLIGGIASTEALKLLLGDERVAPGILWADVWANTFERIEIPRQADCPACGRGDYEFLDSLGDEGGAVLCGRDAVQVRPLGGGAVDLAELAERLASVGEVASNGFLLRLRAEGHELTVFPDGRAIIKGTHDLTEARVLYARYIGM
ncbi:MAG TPA: ThiF family adenylyltransferase [Ktedonobacterales bacterium]